MSLRAFRVPTSVGFFSSLDKSPTEVGTLTPLIRVGFAMTSTSLHILDRERLIERIKTARANGACVVLANGCFDVLHVGHVRYLEAARSLGDLLVVGINSDDQTRRLKGEGRPLVSQNQRAEIISALQAVDYVTIFEEPTVEQ